jgi:hypothetical protein
LFQRLGTRARCEQHKRFASSREWLSGSAKQRARLRDRSSESEKQKRTNPDLCEVKNDQITKGKK